MLMRIVGATEYANTLIELFYADTLSYEFFTYQGVNVKGIVICHKHGEFSRSVSQLKNGKGCDGCAEEAKVR